MEESPPVWKAAANKWNKQSRTADEGWSSSLGVGRSANNPSSLKKLLLYKTHECGMLPLETKLFGCKLPQIRFSGGGGVSLEEVSRCWKRKRDILLGTWNVRNPSIGQVQL
jgi:hypothetical protein